MSGPPTAKVTTASHVHRLSGPDQGHEPPARQCVAPRGRPVTSGAGDPTLGNRGLGVPAELELEGYHGAQPVGRGGFGVVYRCREPALDRVVAVKILSSDPDDVDIERFHLEQRAMGRVSGHPNIVPVLRSGLTATGRPYIVMPYHSRDTLGAWVNRHGPVAVGEALTIGVRLAGALETAHRAGVLHGDVKPENVLLTNYGEPQLSDFGVARLTDVRRTATKSFVGSPSYTAPELLTGGPPSQASDIYSLAATVFALICGAPASRLQSEDGAGASVRRGPPGSIPDLRGNGVPDAVCAALELGMAVDPAARPGSAAAFGAALRVAGAQIGVSIAEVPLELAPLDPLDPSAAGGGASSGSGSGTGATPRSAIAHPTGPPAYPFGPSAGRRTPTPPTPPTRLRPTTLSRPTVPRRRILERLGAAPRPKVVLIHAPAGYGKSILAAQWTAALARQQVNVGWLAVHNDDNNADWFVAHLIEAIRQSMPDLADVLEQEFEGHFENTHQYVFSALIEYLHSTGQTLALVIDDWHRIVNTETATAFGYLLENCCHHMHLVVVSRTRTDLPLSTLRVQGELADVDAELLRFDVAESRALLVDQWSIGLTEANVAALQESTDGWAAALQLAALSLRDDADPDALMERMSGRDEALGEYLTSNVLGGIEPALLDFLLVTCVPAQICGGLATALTGDDRSARTLEEIERRGLFLRKTDRNGHWYEYHHLFADYLLHRLERDTPARVPELHRRAARWCSEQQMHSQAVDHLIRAGDVEQAVDTVERVAPELLEQSRMNVLLVLAGKLPAEHIDARPRLQTDLAWANVALYRLAAAKRPLRLAEAALRLRPEDETLDLHAEILLAREIMAVFQDRMDNADEAIEACVSRADTLRPRILCIAASLGTYRALRAFDLEEARRWQTWGRQHHRGMSPTFSVTVGYCLGAIAANEQLDVAAAEAQLRHAIRTGLLPSGRPSHTGSQAGALLGALLYEYGRLDEAEPLLDDAYDRLQGAPADFLIEPLATGARLKLARGDAAAADRRLARGLELAAKLRMPRLTARLLYEQVRLAALSTEPIDKALVRQVMGLGAQRINEKGDDTAEFKEDAQIRLLLLDGKPASISAACQRAHVRLALVDPVKRPRARLNATIQMALCLAVAGNVDQARRTLAPALRICAALGLSRLIVDEGPRMVRLAQDAAVDIEHRADDTAMRTRVHDFALSLAATSTGQHLFDAMTAARSRTPAIAPRMTEAVLNNATVHRPLFDADVVQRPELSQRERDVLIAWCQTDSKQEAAKRLFIEPSTVATHLQRVRAKYAAVGRPATTKAALVARAIQDGILSLEHL
jgi:ATP/maltotriose-dependent transcriptional regulator MalT/serine/threonine protein kinase